MALENPTLQLQVGVKLLIRNSSGQYLMIRRTDSAGGGWDVPGGRIEPHEPLEVALRREVTEEIGVEIGGKLQLVNAQDIFADDKQLHVVRLTYLAFADVAIQSLTLSDEHQAVEWWSMDNTSIVPERFLAETLRFVNERGL